MVMLGCISCLVFTDEHCCISSYPFIISGVSFSCATPLVMLHTATNVLQLFSLVLHLPALETFSRAIAVCWALYTSTLSLDVDYHIRPNVCCLVAGPQSVPSLF